MNKQIKAAWKPLAAIGLALALAGCGNKGGVGGSTATGSTGGGDTLATVGGTAITRTELNKILEAQGGQQVLPVLIDTQLLTQDAKDKGITVSDADIAAELDRRKKDDPALAETLTKNPRLADILSLQIRRDLVTQKLLTKDVKVSDDELQKFFNEHKADYEKPTKIKIGRLLTSTKARADAMDRALKSKTKTFAQLVEEQQKSSDPLAKGSDLGNEQSFDLNTLPDLVGPADAKIIGNLPTGGTTAPKQINIGQGKTAYVIYSITDKQEPPKADFTALKSQVETDYKMTQVAKDEVKKNKENPSFEEAFKRTRQYIQQQQMQQQMQQNPMAPPPPPPSMRDVLTVILQPLQQNILTELRSKGLVKIDDPAYTNIAKGYEAVPTPVPPAAGGADANAAPAAGTDANAAPAAGTDANAAPAAAPATNAAPAPATP